MSHGFHAGEKAANGVSSSSEPADKMECSQQSSTTVYGFPENHLFQPSQLISNSQPVQSVSQFQQQTSTEEINQHLVQQSHQLQYSEFPHMQPINSTANSWPLTPQLCPFNMWYPSTQYTGDQQATSATIQQAHNLQITDQQQCDSDQLFVQQLLNLQQQNFLLQQYVLEAFSVCNREDKHTTATGQSIGIINNGQPGINSSTSPCQQKTTAAEKITPNSEYQQRSDSDLFPCKQPTAGEMCSNSDSRIQQPKSSKSAAVGMVKLIAFSRHLSSLVSSAFCKFDDVTSNIKYSIYLLDHRGFPLRSTDVLPSYQQHSSKQAVDESRMSVPEESLLFSSSSHRSRVLVFLANLSVMKIVVKDQSTHQ